MESIFRFIAGGVVVSVFAVLGDLFEPKSFAGIFGAAPSIALATLALTISHDGKHYAAIEARSMIAGGVALFVYTSMASWLMMRHNYRASVGASALLPLWIATAVGLWFVCLR